MEIQVCSKTIQRISNQYERKQFVTRKDIPDLNCKYVGKHLKRGISKVHPSSIAYHEVPFLIHDEFGVLYNDDQYTKKSVLHRVKKIKF